MPLYPLSISRCQHIKINGIQCGSPALRETNFCYYHVRYHWNALEKLENKNEFAFTIPTLEDGNSVQVSLAKVLERLAMQEIDHKSAALMLYALQTAAINMKQTSLEPKLPTQVVIDRGAVSARPIGASAWSPVEGREYDDITEPTSRQPESARAKLDSEKPDSEKPAEEPVLEKFLPQSAVGQVVSG